MSKSDEYRPKLSILLTDEQRQKLNRLLPWGSGTLLFSAIVDELIEVLEEYGHAAIGLIVSKRACMLDLIKLREKERESGFKQPKTKGSRRPSEKRTNGVDTEDQSK